MVCLSFDIEDDAGNYTCNLARNDLVEVEDCFGDFGVMRFEIEKMPCEFI